MTKARATLTPLRFYWGGYAVSQVGTAAWRLILPWAVYRESESPLQLAGFLALMLLPELLLMPVAGWVADRFRRAVVIGLADGVRAVAYVFVATIVWRARISTDVLDLLIAMTGIDGVVQMVSQSARAAVLNEFAGGDRARLRSLLATDRCVRLVGDLSGFLLGGFLAAVPVCSGLGINGISFLVAAVSVVPLRIHARSVATAELGGGHRRGADWRRVFVILRQHPVVADATVRQFVANLCIPVATIGIPVSITEQGERTTWLGLATALFAVGAFVSADWQRRHPREPSPTGSRAWLVVIIWVTLLVCALTLPTVTRFGIFLPVGAIGSWLLIESQSQWQSSIAPEEVGHIAALASIAARCGALIALLVVGTVVAAYNLTTAAVVIAAGVILLSVVGARVQRRFGESLEHSPLKEPWCCDSASSRAMRPRL